MHKLKYCLIIGLLFSQIIYAQSNKPNIIYILADDLGMGDISLLGQQEFATPNIDKIGREGMVFTNHYAGSTVCAPSRCALLTGKDMGHASVRMNRSLDKKRIPINDADITIAEVLKKADYVCGATGKWGLGEIGTEGVPWKQGFDYWYGYINQKNAHSYYPPFLYENDKKVELKGNQDGKKTTYSQELIIDKSLQFIEKNQKNPFFLYFSVTLPHAHLEINDQYLAPYLAKVNTGKWTKKQAIYAAMVAKLDTDIGAILNKIKALGLDENTLVIFTSDNGAHTEDGMKLTYFNSTNGMRGQKRDLYEGGIHVPMMARWPNMIKKGSQADHISAFWDVLPTFCDIAKQKKPKDINGISFLPTLLRKKQKKHKYLYWEFLGRGNIRQAIRMGNWKAVRYSYKNAIELYNLANDPAEKKDVAKNNKRLVKKAKRIFVKAHVENPNYAFDLIR